MIGFLVISFLLVVVSLALILAPVVRPRQRVADHGATAANVAVYRSQLTENAAEGYQRSVPTTQRRQAREELEQRLAADLSQERRPGRDEGASDRRGGLIPGLTVGLPLIAVLLYLMVGTPSP